MFNKILIFWIWSLAAILIIENFAVSTPAFVFLERNSSSWMLAFISTLCWIAVWYWIKWFLSEDKGKYDENLDF